MSAWLHECGVRSVPAADRALPPALRSRRRPPAVRAGFDCGADISGLRRAQQRHVRLRSGASHTAARRAGRRACRRRDGGLCLRVHAELRPQPRPEFPLARRGGAAVRGVRGGDRGELPRVHPWRVQCAGGPRRRISRRADRGRSLRSSLHIQRDAVGGVPELGSLICFRASRTLRTGPAPETP